MHIRIPSRFFPAISVPLLLLCGSACDRLSNQLAELALDCGSNTVDGQVYVKILDPRGQPVDDGTIEAFTGTEEREQVQVSSRGCVAINSVKGTNNDNADAPGIIVRSRDKQRNWGQILDEGNRPFTRQLRLQDVSGESLEFSCPRDNFSRGRVPQPVVAKGAFAAHFPLQLEVVKEADRYPLGSFQLTDDSLLFPPNLKDGDLKVVFRYENLFRDQTEEKTCELRLDRSAPALRSNLDAAAGRIRAGESIIFQVTDENPLSVNQCLRAYDDAESCTKDEDFELATGMISPESGKWCLHAFALDQAGNRSEPFERCFIAWQDLTIERIEKHHKLALSQATEDHLLSAVYLLRAFKDFFGLVTGEEMASVADPLMANALSVGSMLRETNRMRLSTYVLDWEAVADLGFLTRHMKEGLQYWNRDGRFLDSIPNIGQPVFSYSLNGSRLVLGTVNGFTVYDLSSGSFQKILSGSWPDDFRPRVLSWNPVRDEFVGTSPGESRIFAFKGQNYESTSVFPLANVTQLNWSPDGDRLVGSGNGRVSIWKRGQGNGSWMEIFVETGGDPDGPDSFIIQGALFFPQATLFVSETGELRLLKNGAETAEIIKGIRSDGPNAIRADSRLMALDDDSALFFTGRDIFRVELDANQNVSFSKAYPGFTDLTRSWTWAPAEGGISLVYPDRVYRLRSLPLSRDLELAWLMTKDNQRFIAGLDLGGQYLTVDSDAVVRFWSFRSLWGSLFPGASSFKTRWLDDDRVLHSSQGVARIWNSSGTLSLSLPHGDPEGSSTNIAVNEAGDRYLTVGNGLAKIWNADGSLTQSLYENVGEPSTYYQGSFAAASPFLAVARSDQVDFWEEKIPGFFEQIQSTKTFPNTVRWMQSFRWKDQDVLFVSNLNTRSIPFSFAFLDFRGNLSPVWPRGITHAVCSDITTDGRYLTLIDSRTHELQSFELTEGGYVARHEPVANPNLACPVRVTSPDGQRIMVFPERAKPILYKWVDGTFVPHILNQAFPTIHAGDLAQGLWSHDSQRYYFAVGHRVFIADREGKLLQQLEPFESGMIIEYLDLSRRNVLAVTARGLGRTEIRFLPFVSMADARASFCNVFGSFLKWSDQIDRIPELTSNDRLLCD